MLEKLTELIVEKLDVDAEKVTNETSFKEDLEIDSLDLFDLVMNVEEAFGVEIPSEDLENIKTVGDMVAYLESHGANA
ncbi:MAG: acyl carrier protein [Lachnospiraceae bacterium]|nr:acyl carrier protein [Lachnospiraceae bacterium]